MSNPKTLLQCPTCPKQFVNLKSHKCKVVSPVISALIAPVIVQKYAKEIAV